MLSRKKVEEEGKGQGQPRSAHLEDMSATLRVLDGCNRDERGSGKSKKMRQDRRGGEREREPTHQFLSS